MLDKLQQSSSQNVHPRSSWIQTCWRPGAVSISMFSLYLHWWSNVLPQSKDLHLWGKCVGAPNPKAAGMFSGITVTPLAGKAVEDGWSNITMEMGSRMTAPLWLRDGSRDRGRVSSVPHLVHEKLDVLLLT